MPRRGSILPVRRRFPPPCERIFTPTVTSTVQGVYRRPRWQQVEKAPRFSGFMDVPWVSETLPQIISSASADFCVTIGRRRSKQSRYIR